MSAAAGPSVVRETPGRLRVRVPGARWGDPAALAASLRQLRGVRRATASAATGNALVEFDPAVTDAGAILAAIDRGLPPAPEGEPEPRRAPPAAGPRVQRSAPGRVRIAVRGIDRDPQMARQVVDRLRDRRGVDRVVASATTGRVLVEFSRQLVDIEDLLAIIAEVEPPPVGDEPVPAHPLDPAPVIQSTARLIGSALGLGLIAVRRARPEPPAPMGGGRAVTAAAVVGSLEGLPPVRAGLRHLLGHDRAQLVLGGAGILTLTLSGAPLGLALTGAAALRAMMAARARRAAWRRYEELLERRPPANPGAVIRLEDGDCVPLRARVVEGTGTAVGREGEPVPLRPDATVEAGARVFGGPFVVELEDGEGFMPQPRPAPARASPLDRYLMLIGPVSLAAAAGAGILRRSLSGALTALLLVNPRPALVGAEAADESASARVLRAGVLVVGTRPERPVRRPDVLLLDGPRLVTDGWEVERVVPMPGQAAADLEEVVAALLAETGSPWGDALAVRAPVPAEAGEFDGETASATIEGVRYHLGPSAGGGPGAGQGRERGEHPLVLRRDGGEPLGVATLRPRMAPALDRLLAACEGHGVDVALLGGDSPGTHAIAQRAGVQLVPGADRLTALRDRQRTGALVAFVSDSAAAAAAFDASDLAIAVSPGQRGSVPARADLLAPDLDGVAAVIEAAARRDEAVQASIALSGAANVAGAAWGLRGGPGLVQASYTTYAAALAAIAAGWLRLRGGELPESAVTRLVDPRPERWGRQSAEEILAAFSSSPDGLTSEEAARRTVPPARARGRNPILAALDEQLRSPLSAVLGAGAALSLVLGAGVDVALIAAVIAGNAVVGAWEERQAGEAARELERIGSVHARVLRDGRPQTVAAQDVVPGDVLVLASGDRIAADARLIEAEGLEVDEAALTGESLPVAKSVDAGSHAARVVLEGSDVVAGTGRAVVVAVGRETRMGAIAAALELDPDRTTPLGRRLASILRGGLPAVVAGGLVVAAAGLLRGGGLLSQLAIGASVAIAAVPEGLPLLSGVGEAAVARRLARTRAVVRRLAAVEALGRVDVACCDKTGTLTTGRLAVARAVTAEEDVRLPGDISPTIRDVLLVAALASPHPEAAGARSHPTDVAVVEAARRAGLDGDLATERVRESPFEPSRGFHAAVVDHRLCVKGAAETLVPRCTAIRRGGAAVPADDAARDELLRRVEELSGQGLRVLLVAEGDPATELEDLGDLVALGLIGIADPVRPGVPAAVRRCLDAGVRLIMLTGDHPATARAIARDAGLVHHADVVLVGDELAALDDRELEERLELARIIARITPLEKVRIVEALQRRGHTVAMTGDGVNDAPALRLADAGIAMGRGGTEVARQASDVVLTDDELSSLVEALVEGRVFWQNMRRALGLLLGGNLGELVAMAGLAGLGGPGAALTTRQILGINLVTDVLPALAVAVQGPEHRRLAELAREGGAALGRPLTDEIARRGAATAVPSLGAYLLASGPAEQRRSVAFASLVATQLGQTLDIGIAERRLSPSVGGAVAASGALLAAAFLVPPVRAFFGLALPTPGQAGLVAAAVLASVVLGRLSPRVRRPRALLPARAIA